MRKMDIDERIQKILSKYGLQESEAEKRRKIYRIIRNVLKDVNKKFPCVAIRCAGCHTAKLISEFKDILKVDYLIDKEPTKVIPRILELGIPIHEKVRNNLDAIIVGTFDYRKEIKQELRENECKNVIDIYDILEQNGFFLQCEFYNYYSEPYQLLIELKQQSIHCDDSNDKEKLIKRLIKEFLGIRDFVSAFKWMEEYRKHNFSDVETIEKLEEELKEFLSEVKRVVMTKEKQDIVWFWQDGLPQYSVDGMPFLSSMKRDGVYFKNSFAHSPVTRSVYGNILDKTMEIDRHKGLVRTENHRFVKYLQGKGYKVLKIRPIEKGNINLNFYDYNKSDELIIADVALTEIYWSALRTIILENETSLVLLLHTGLETHLPVMAPTLDKYVFHQAEYYEERFEIAGREQYLKNLKNTTKYVDDELKFMASILGENITKIYMSDHGDLMTKESYMFTRDAMQSVLAIDSKNLHNIQFGKLFPLSNFLELFKYILDPTEENEKNMFVEDMRITGVDFYNLKLIQQLIKMDFAKYGIAYDGYLTTDDRYVMLATGEEIYSTVDQDLVNGIDFPQNQPKVHKWRERITADGYRFLHNKDFPKFANSKYLYEALGKKRMWD